MQKELLEPELVAMCERRGLALRPAMAIIALLNNRVDEARMLLGVVVEKAATDPEAQRVLAAVHTATRRPRVIHKTILLDRAGVRSSEMQMLERGIPFPNWDRSVARLKQVLHENGVTIAAPADSSATPTGDPS